MIENYLGSKLLLIKFNIILLDTINLGNQRRIVEGTKRLT